MTGNCLTFHDYISHREIVMSPGIAALAVAYRAQFTDKDGGMTDVEVTVLKTPISEHAIEYAMNRG